MRAGKGTWSIVAIIGALVAIASLATAAALWVADLDRLAILFAFFGTIVPTLIATFRADQAAGQTNGSLDTRISEAVQAALSVRRHTDAAVVTSPTTDPTAADPLTVPPPE